MSSKRTKIADRWWDTSPSDVHKDIWATVTHIRDITSNRRAAEKKYWELYTNNQVTGLEGITSIDSRFNLIAQGVDTAAAQIIKVHKPLFTTTDSDFSLQRMARKLTQVTEGQLIDLDCDREMSQMFLDAAVTGTGHLFGYLDPETNEPRVQRCLPGSILVDPRDGQREDPYTIYYRVPIARDVLLEQYPSEARHIEKASGPTTQDRVDLWLSAKSTVDDVMVVYSFHRPSTKSSKDGRFVVSTSTGTLVDETWDEELPFITYRWKHRPGSYYGIGIPEAGMLSQARYKRLEIRVERMQDLGSTAWVISEKNNNVRVEKLTNNPYTIVHYDGQGGIAPPPTMQLFSGTPPDLIQEQERIREQFLAEQGISQMSAQGVKPAGLNSAISQRTYQEIAQTRQKQQAKGWEYSYTDLFKLLLRLNGRAAKLSPEYKVIARTTAGRQSMLSEVEWKDVNLPANKYRVSCWPISDVPSGPAGKLELVSEWIASGLTSRWSAQNMMMESSLDTDSTSRLELADLDRTMYDIERIEDGYQVAPDPYVDMTLSADVARRAYVHRSCQNVPEPILKMMRKYVDACIAAKEEAAAKAAANQPPGPGAASGAPSQDPNAMAMAS